MLAPVTLLNHLHLNLFPGHLGSVVRCHASGEKKGLPEILYKININEFKILFVKLLLKTH